MASESKLDRLTREKEQFWEESIRHVDNEKTLGEELDKLQRQLESTTDEKKKKPLQEQMRLTKAKKELANSKAGRASALAWQIDMEREDLLGNAVTEGEIQNQKRRVEEWENNVEKIEMDINQLEMKGEQDKGFQVTYIEGYKCVAYSTLGFIYFPEMIPLTHVNIECVNDDTMFPTKSANEVSLTPVVSITSQSKVFTKDKPIVIELMKTCEVNASESKKVVPMFSNTDDSTPPNWEDLQEECEMLDDRIRFKTKHFTYFTVIARFSPPTASIIVDPKADSSVQLTVPQLPGFMVTIPAGSVPSPIQVKATLDYDVRKESASQPLASASVRLEPDGHKFSEKVSVRLPIPGCSKIIADNPNAKLQLMYSPSGHSNDWEIHNDINIEEIGGDTFAYFSTDHFSLWELTWSGNVYGIAKAIGTIFKRANSLAGRCQVFMTRETEVGPVINVSMQVLVYSFRDPPEEIPHNYHYVLHDSGKLPVKFTSGKLHFTLEMKEYLFPEKDVKIRFEECYKLSQDFAAQPDFDIDFDKKSKSRLKEGAVLANLHIKNSDGSIEHKCNLIKPPCLEKVEQKIVPSESVVVVFLPSLSATTRLGEESLKEINTCLWRARFKWRSIGDALKIDPSTLEVINLDNRKVDECFVAVLKKWLRKGKPVPCWKLLAEALSSPPVGIIVEEKGKENESQGTLVSNVDEWKVSDNDEEVKRKEDPTCTKDKENTGFSDSSEEELEHDSRERAVLYWDEGRKLGQEMEKCTIFGRRNVRKQDETTDRRKIKQLRHDMWLTKAKRDLANSKAGKASALALLSDLEQDNLLENTEIKSEIQHQKERVKEWEDDVKKNERIINQIEKGEWDEDHFPNHIHGQTATTAVRSYSCPYV